MNVDKNDRNGISIAIIIPCLNEGAAIAHVVKDFSEALPNAIIYVYDNGSEDDTTEQAEKAGAIVCHEKKRGKGRALLRAFADIDADIYLIADGDGTYDASYASVMVEKIQSAKIDMVTGVRKDSGHLSTYRQGHRFGNRFLTAVANFVFQENFQDVLSGYRAFTRRFVKSFTWQPRGFEVEMMLTLHGAEINASHLEIPIKYHPRIEGTKSKLRTYRDGGRILLYALILMKEAQPFRFFGWLALILISFATVLMIPLVREYLITGLVPRFPTLIFATGVSIVAAVLFFSGIILDSVARRAKELKRFAYLSQSIHYK